MSDNDGLNGRRVLVVEDEMMIAMLVEDMLGDLGCSVVGPAHGLQAAMTLAEESTDLDAALLDVNLAGQPVFPVADVLRARNVPIIFCTGYGDAGLREADRGAPVLQKPYRARDLAETLATALKVA
ncbi:MAG: response regulator [Caulobacteraceae bacterium]|nr:response regulator [Caulobacteraceae bacterium]